jgi:hypothetical protein
LSPFEDVGVEGVHEYYFSEFPCFGDGWRWLDPFSEEATVEGVEVVSDSSQDSRLGI